MTLIEAIRHLEDGFEVECKRHADDKEWMLFDKSIEIRPIEPDMVFRLKAKLGYIIPLTPEEIAIVEYYKKIIDRGEEWRFYVETKFLSTLFKKFGL